jgi:predicted ATPase
VVKDNSGRQAKEPPSSDAPVRIRSFAVTDLFGKRGTTTILFPDPDPANPASSILILAGRNGSGKTTILTMIAGMLKLDFDEFRRVPFKSAVLELSDNRQLKVTPQKDPNFPLLVNWERFAVILGKSKENPGYNPQQRFAIEEFRASALPVTRNINFELLSIHRSQALRQAAEEEYAFVTSTSGGVQRVSRRGERQRALAERVREFVREAQLNYRRYFALEEGELLPRMLQRLQLTSSPINKKELINRVATLRQRVRDSSRFGLATDTFDLDNLEATANNIDHFDDNGRLIIESYLEMQESRQNLRDTISDRFVKFEQVMDDFLGNKTVRINAHSGLTIKTDNNHEIEETDLSSGEYHFLYMMVSALLCKRVGSIIAIDEPELSLHIKWQRKLLAALSKCASGAAPLFLFATHSMSIIAEHKNSVHELSELE